LFAFRMIPMTIAGIPLGYVADRWGKRNLLIASNFMSALVGLSLALVPPGSSAAPILAAAGVLGFLDAGRIVASQSLTFDVAGRDDALGAIAFSNVLTGIGGVVGALVGGLALDLLGPSAASAVFGFQYAIGGVTLALAGTRPAEKAVDKGAPQSPGSDGVIRPKVIVTLSVVAVLVEILGFSALTLDAVFASEVFAVGAFGLGLLSASRSLGRLAGALTLALNASRIPPVPTLTFAVALFGACLIGYSATQIIVIGLVFVFMTGAAGAIVDSLLQMLLQSAVPESNRGLGMGVWVFSIGLAPIGAIEVATLATAVGAQAAQALNGFVLLGFALLLWFGPLLRDVHDFASATVGPSTASSHATGSSDQR
jgi:MFS family permease